MDRFLPRDRAGIQMDSNGDASRIKGNLAGWKSEPKMTGSVVRDGIRTTVIEAGVGARAQGSRYKEWTSSAIIDVVRETLTSREGVAYPGIGRCTAVEIKDIGPGHGGIAAFGEARFTFTSQAI